MGQDDVRREGSELCRVFANCSGIARGPTGINAHVLADAPARLLQSLQERSEPCLEFRIVRSRSHDDSDPPHALGLLRMNRGRPGSGKAGNRFDELAPSHCRPLERDILPAKNRVPKD